MNIQIWLPIVWLIGTFVVGGFIARRQRSIVPVVISILVGWMGWGFLTWIIQSIVFIHERTISMQNLV